MNALIILVLEDNWIIKLLFPNDIKETYDKKYSASKKQTSHLLISNVGEVGEPTVPPTTPSLTTWIDKSFSLFEYIILFLVHLAIEFVGEADSGRCSLFTFQVGFLEFGIPVI